MARVGGERVLVGWSRTASRIPLQGQLIRLAGNPRKRRAVASIMVRSDGRPSWSSLDRPSKRSLQCRERPFECPSPGPATQPETRHDARPQRRPHAPAARSQRPAPRSSRGVRSALDPRRRSARRRRRWRSSSPPSIPANTPFTKLLDDLNTEWQTDHRRRRLDGDLPGRGAGRRVRRPPQDPHRSAPRRRDAPLPASPTSTTTSASSRSRSSSNPGTSSTTCSTT